ncbi:MAG: EAL domain-containing protein [Acidobacteriota bacterium]
MSAAVMALLLFGFNRQYEKSYLTHWALGWVALSIHHCAIAVNLFLFRQYHVAALHPVRVSITVVGSAFAYMEVGWLVFGVYELIRRLPVRLVHARRILAALAITGAAAAAFLLAAGDVYAVARIGVRSAIAAVGFIAVSIALWKTRFRREGFGFIVLSLAFFFYGLEEIHYVVRSVLFMTTGYLDNYAGYLGYLDLILETSMGVGMIACLLEDEREAAELASVEIEHLAYHDAMTGLPNRPLFIDRLIVALAQAGRANYRLAVFFLDLDRFKNINDSLGHTAGDSLLKGVADRIRQCVREGDTVARFGGDEFTLLIPRIDNVEDAAKIAQKIIEMLKIPFFVNDRELFVTTSIGISIYPGDGLDPETLVRNADTAMYRAKDRGRDNYQLYTPAMNARALERLGLENQLRKALSQDELRLFYQPVIALETRAIIGMEALLRWQHPEMGLLAPAHFISVAEVSGLIIPIGEWVLRVACKQLKAWHKRTSSDLTISVNLSARQFQQPDLIGQVRQVLQDSALEARFLELEITESNAMQNAENSIYSLRELKNIGVRIAMDDFGTGYSSLNYLKRFPIDTLKLDQSFVHDVTTDPRDAAIVSAVISMAHSLELEVVAEGVETEDQLAFLRKQKCDRIQGFLFSEPLPVEEMEALLLERRTMTV